MCARRRKVKCTSEKNQAKNKNAPTLDMGPCRLKKFTKRVNKLNDQR
jgi:hypothetical protein